MKTDLHLAGPVTGRRSGGDGATSTSVRHATPIPVARRFAPVVQVLTPVDPGAEARLLAVARQSFAEGKALKDICTDLYRFARASGYEATIGVQEVYSTSMPSFPGQTVISALLMVDLRPLWTTGESVFVSYGNAG